MAPGLHHSTAENQGHVYRQEGKRVRKSRVPSYDNQLLQELAQALIHYPIHKIRSNPLVGTELVPMNS